PLTAMCFAAAALFWKSIDFLSLPCQGGLFAAMFHAPKNREKSSENLAGKSAEKTAFCPLHP
ncbi:MAG: hypothetical protein IKU12_04240, partial [Oscillospiraceae bacterium]|nr:hypothetical protein [Oscillospiraceae bacterium]